MKEEHPCWSGGAGLSNTSPHPRLSNIHDDGAFKCETAEEKQRNRQLSWTGGGGGGGLLNISAVDLHPFCLFVELNIVFSRQEVW